VDTSLRAALGPEHIAGANYGGLRRRDWNPATVTTLVGMGRTPTDDFKAMRTTIGVEERKLLSEVLRQPLPAEMADLLKQLDQPTEGNFDADNAADNP
jgi:hypothetical protein